MNPGPSCYVCVNPSPPLSSVTRQIAELKPTREPAAAVCPAHKSLYGRVTQTATGQSHELPLKHPTPATTVTTRSDQTQGLSHACSGLHEPSSSHQEM